MSRLFSVTVTEHVDGALSDSKKDGKGALVSAECAANVLRCIASDIAVHDWYKGKLTHPDD